MSESIAMERGDSLLGALAEHQAGNQEGAERILLGFLQGSRDLNLSSRPQKVEIRQDSISLNSLNGVITLEDETRLFFKFHRESGQSAATEYYNAKTLVEQGFPCIEPLHLSREPGNEILIYPYIEAERLFDVCGEIEKTDPGLKTPRAAQVVGSQRELDRFCGEAYIGSLHQADADQLKKEPLVQLFYRRIVDGEGRYPGGRLKSFYMSGEFALPGGLRVAPKQLFDLRWVVNGIEYAQTLRACFDQANELMNPAKAGTYPAVAGHGDALPAIGRLAP